MWLGLDGDAAHTPADHDALYRRVQLAARTAAHVGAVLAEARRAGTEDEQRVADLVDSVKTQLQAWGALSRPLEALKRTELALQKNVEDVGRQPGVLQAAARAEEQRLVEVLARYVRHVRILD